MRAHEFLAEGRDAPLYHFMDLSKTLLVLCKDLMPAHWQHELPTDPGKHVLGNSFTRSKSLVWGDMIVRLSVDQRLLAQTNRIIPLDGHYVHSYTRGRFGTDDVRSRTKTGKNADPHEEFVVGDIKTLHRYLTRIELRHASGPDEYLASLVDVVSAYAQKWEVPVEIAPEVTRRFAQWCADGHELHPQIRDFFPDYQRPAVKKRRNKRAPR